MLLLFGTHVKDEVWWECLSLTLTGTWISRSATLLNFSTRNNKIFESNPDIETKDFSITLYVCISKDSNSQKKYLWSSDNALNTPEYGFCLTPIFPH